MAQSQKNNLKDISNNLPEPMTPEEITEFEKGLQQSVESLNKEEVKSN